MKIAYRSSENQDFSQSYNLKVGMCLTARVNNNREPVMYNYGHHLPYADFCYIVYKIDDNLIYLIDTAHNNQWDIKKEHLDTCELVMEFHGCHDHIDCSYINDVLSFDDKE